MTFDAVGAAWFVLDTSLRALAAAAAVALILRVLRLRGAAVLHSAWTAVLVAMLLMPVLPSIVPALPVPVPAAAGGVPGAASGTAEAPETRNPVPIAPPGDSVRPADRLAAPVAGARGARPWIPLLFLGIYAAGVLLIVARLLHGWCLALAVIRRARRGGPIPAGIAEPVYQSSEVTVPLTIGAVRPVIVLPVTWQTWDSDKLTAILAHEARTCTGTTRRSTWRPVSTVPFSGSIRSRGGSSGSWR